MKSLANVNNAIFKLRLQRLYPKHFRADNTRFVHSVCPRERSTPFHIFLNVENLKVFHLLLWSI